MTEQCVSLRHTDESMDFYFLRDSKIQLIRVKAKHLYHAYVGYKYHNFHFDETSHMDQGRGTVVCLLIFLCYTKCLFCCRNRD